MSVSDIVKAALPETTQRYGPWDGYMSSRAADEIPPNYAAATDSDDAADNFLYQPRTGYWKRRKGQTIQFDTLPSASGVGLLPSKWSGKCRQLEEFSSSDIDDSIPTLIALVTRETVSAGLDDGRFSVVWVRDQVNSVNYTVGSEFSTVTYPSPGTEATYKVCPLWYESGEGGITRGVEEFQRRFFWSGSRRMQKVGRWTYFPSVLGTPARWMGMQALGSTSIVFPNLASPDESSASWSKVGGATARAVLSDSSDATYIQSVSGFPVDMYVKMDSMSTPTSATIKARIRKSGAGGFDQVSLYGACGAPVFGGGSDPVFVGDYASGATSVYGPVVSGSFAEYAYPLTADQIGLIAAGSGGWGNMYVGFRSSGGNVALAEIAELWIEVPTSDADKRIRIIPSGPLPPIHAGTLAATTQVENPTTFMRPSGDSIDGNWVKSSDLTNTDLYTMIDEESASDTDYITTPDDSTDTTCELTLSALGFTPSADDSITMRVRLLAEVGGYVELTLFEGAVLKKTWRPTPQSDTFAEYSIQLTATEITSISDWSNVLIRFSKYDLGGFNVVGRVSYFAIEHLPGGDSSEGGWRGSDKFYYSVAYRFEDDSIWMPCTPRGPNDILADGYNLFTVDASNLSAGYQKVVWSNIPIGPYGTKSRILLRSPKIDSRTDSTLQLNPTDLRVVWEIKDNVTTTYDDFYADDDALGLDVDQLLIRDDHIMPPRSRYIFGGDARVCHSYGGLNPCAIVFAPIDFASGTTYDRNLDDENATLWGANTFYYRVTSTALELYSDTGSALSSATSFAFSTYTTLEKLVDAINSTTITSNAKAWRAQLCPGAPAQADPATSLTPTVRAISSCVVDNTAKTITKAAGGLSDVPVGNYITSSGAYTAGAYVDQITSDTVLHYSGSITGGTVTLTFVPGTGDTVTGASNAYGGYIRALSGSLPSFLFLNKTALDREPLEKSSVWMTVASPGAVKSAANSFSGKISNKFTPPEEAGISVGGRAVDNGFVTPFSKKRAVIRNTRDSGTGIDSDYRLFITNESSGCCAWQSIAEGTRCVFMFSPEGWIAQDLGNEMLLSEAIWDHSTSRGDFSYEAPLCIAATGSDTDTAYMIGRVMRGALWVKYRVSGDTTPSRQIVYDFSSGTESSGLAALIRSPGRVWGWSLPLERVGTAMAEGRRSNSGSEGAHLYVWSDANAGSTGDGRVDEFEVTEQDNTANFNATLTLPWYRVGSNKLSAQEITLEHATPSGATVALDFHRSYSDTDLYTLTPSTGSAIVIRDVKLLSLPARSPTAACYLGFRQSAGTASEVRRIELRVKSLPSYS